MGFRGVMMLCRIRDTRRPQIQRDRTTTSDTIVAMVPDVPGALAR